MRRQSVSAAVAARAWQAASSAWRTYGPGGAVRVLACARAAFALARAARPWVMSSRFQRPRSCSSSVTGGAARAGAGGDAGRLDLHQRDQPVRLRFFRRQRRQHPAQAHRLVAQLRPVPGLPRRRRVALVEDQVHDLEDGAEPVGELRADRHLEPDLRVREGLLRPGDPGRHRRRRDQERPRDLLGRQAADQLERQRHPAVAGEHRVAGGEDQLEHVVGDVGVELDLVHRVLRLRVQPGLDVELGGLPLEGDGAPYGVDVTTARDRGQPGAGVVGHALRGPLLERGHQRVLRQVLGQPDIPGHPGQRGDEPRRLDPPDRLDGPLRPSACSDKGGA